MNPNHRSPGRASAAPWALCTGFALLGIAAGALAQPQQRVPVPGPFDSQLDALGSPARLEFLRGLAGVTARDPALASVIANRLERARQEGGDAAIIAADQDIRGHVNASMLTAGAVDARLGLQAISGGRTVREADAQRFTESLRRLGPAVGGPGTQLGAMLPAGITREWMTITYGGTPILEAANAAPTIVNPPRPVTRQQDLLCNLRHDQLNGTLQGTRRTEPFARSEFREVVVVTAYSADDGLDPRSAWANDPQSCTGTLISPRHVLTAAHCFAWQWQAGRTVAHRSSRAFSGASNRDWDVARAGGGGPTRHHVTLPPLGGGQGRQVDVLRVVVHGGYSGPGAFVNDVAILELENHPELTTVTPAQLARGGADISVLTIAGYGYTADDGSVAGRELNIGWPPVGQRDGRYLSVSFASAPQDTGESAICPGDSGGPAFVGRHRGCPDNAEAGRPRSVAGINSHIDNRDNATEIRGAQCLRSRWNRFSAVTNPEIRAWICSRTANAAGGCSQVQ